MYVSCVVVLVQKEKRNNTVDRGVEWRKRMWRTGEGKVGRQGVYYDGMVDKWENGICGNIG